MFNAGAMSDGSEKNAAILAAFSVAKEMLKWRAFYCGECGRRGGRRPGHSIKSSHFGPRHPHELQEAPFAYKIANAIASRRIKVSDKQHHSRDQHAHKRYLSLLRGSGVDVEALPLLEAPVLPASLNCTLIAQFTANIIEYFNRPSPEKVLQIQLRLSPRGQDGKATLAGLCTAANKVLGALSAITSLRDGMHFEDICEGVRCFSRERVENMRVLAKDLAITAQVCQDQNLAVGIAWYVAAAWKHDRALELPPVVALCAS